MKILLVEDHEKSRKSLARLIERRGDEAPPPAGRSLLAHDRSGGRAVRPGAGARPGRRGVNPPLLLSYDFPPIGGGIARWMGELARHYPERSVVVSTGTVAGSAGTDAGSSVVVDRVGVAAGRLRTITGRVRWSLRAERLAKDRRGGEE